MKYRGFWYTIFRLVSLNGYGFSRPIYFVWIESANGYGFSRRMYIEVFKKKKLGATRWLIFDHT